MTDHSDTQLHSLRNFGFQKKILSTNKADFFFINKAYLNAYLQILDGIGQQGGTFALIGEAGVGKTFLLRKLANEALETIRIVFCYSTNLDNANLIELISDQLGIITHKEEHLDQFMVLKDYLSKCPEQGISVALLIDDAHHLGEEVLNHLLKWSSQELAEGHGLRIVLSGPPLLEEILNQIRSKNSLATNIVAVHLEPLDPIDVGTYLSRKVKSTHDLEVSAFFLPSVVEAITAYTKGIPRLINSLYEHALLNMQLNGETNVSVALVKEAASELMLEEKVITDQTGYFSEKASEEDISRLVNPVHEPTPEAHQSSEEKRKKIIDSLLADLADEPEKKHDKNVNETLLPVSPTSTDTMVSFETMHSDNPSHLMQMTRLIQKESDPKDQPGNQNLKSLLVKNPVTTLSRIMRWHDFRSQRTNPQAMHATRVQMTLFILLALMAGVLGGVGSIYLFQILPEWMPEPPPLQREISAPAPAPMHPVTAVAVSDSHEEVGATWLSESEPTAAETSIPAPPSVSLEPPTGPESAASRPSTELESSPVIRPIIESAPPAVEIETSSISPSPSEPMIVETPPAASEPMIVETPPVASEPMIVETPPVASEPMIVETPLISSYMNSGDTLLARGDIASARLFYEAAATVGYAAAMTAVGKTYDPVMLNQLGIKGFRADPVRAAEWYLKAEQAGDPEIVERLEGLKRWIIDVPNWNETELNILRDMLR